VIGATRQQLRRRLGNVGCSENADIDDTFVNSGIMRAFVKRDARETVPRYASARSAGVHFQALLGSWRTRPPAIARSIFPGGGLAR